MGTGQGANPLPAFVPLSHMAPGREWEALSPLLSSRGGEELQEQGAEEWHRHTSY